MKKMKKNKFAVLALILPMLAACSDNNDDPTPTDRTPLSISAGINTRASESTWNQGDAIGVYTLNTGTATVYNNQANFKYTNTTADGATASFVPADAANTAYYPTDGSKVDVLAYYPHAAGNTGTGTLSVNVSNQTNLAAIDFMTADRVTGKSQDDPSVAFAFVHRLTKLNITLKADESLGNINLADAKVTLSGTSATAIFDLFTQQLNASGDKTNIELKGDKAIVIPTPAGSGVAFSIKVGDKTFNAPLPATVALGTGEEATITITLKENPSIPASVTAMIQPWTGGPTEGLTAINIDIPQNDINVDAAITRFSIWKESNDADKRVYTLIGTEWSAAPAPFYTTDAAVADVFKATTTLGTADAITTLTDDLEATATTTEAGKLSIEFAHVNAQLIVNLSKGEGFPEGDDISTATFKLLDYDLTGATNTLIVAPATIAAGTDIAVTIGSRTHSVKVADAIELKKGTINTLNIALKVEKGKTTTSLKVTMKDWEVGSTTNLTAIHITIPKDPATDAPEITTFTLWKNKGKEGAVSADYAYTNGEWNVTGTPFYVEDTAADDEFTAIHTPASAPALGEKDILETPAVKMKDGALALEFKHANAKVTVKLAKGTGFPAATDLSKAQVTFKKDISFTGELNTFIYPATSFAIGDEVATVAAGGHTYTINAKEKIELPSNSHTVFTFTLTPAEIGFNVSSINWGEEVKKDADVKVDVVSSIDLSMLPPGKVEVIIDSHTATYNWTGSGTPVPINPIYWDDIFEGYTHFFDMRFTPDAAGTPEKDVLEGYGVDVPWGHTISFELTHVNAQLTVKLAKGTGYEDAEFETAAAAATITLIGFSDEDYKMKNNQSGIVIPQTVGTVQKVKLEINGHTYTLPLKNVAGFNELLGNKKYTLTATVNKSGLGISIGSIGDWGEGGTGTGDFEY